MRVIDIKPVTGSFNAKNLISCREYEYLFPSDLVFPDGYGEVEAAKVNELVK